MFKRVFRQTLKLI